MYQNRRLNWNIQWGQTGISLAVCLLVEYCCGSLRKLLRGYICPGLSRSKEWIEKKSYFKNCFYNQIYKNIFIKENIRSKYMPIYIENNKVMLKDTFKKIKIEHFYFSIFRRMSHTVILSGFENNIVFSYLLF